MRHGSVIFGIAASLALHGALFVLVARLPASSSSPVSVGAIRVPLRLLEPGSTARKARPAPIAEHRTGPAAAEVPAPPTRRLPPAARKGSPTARRAAPPEAVVRDRTVSPAESSAPAADRAGPPAGGSEGGDGEPMVASGDGTGTGHGGDGSGPATDDVTTGADDVLSDLRRAYALEVRRSLETLGRYRSVARRLGLAGRVVLRVRIDDAGRVTERAIDAPSRYRELDAAALDSTRRLQALGPPPGGAIDVVVPVVFTMRGR